jgi:murein DD-endopeptidase MepM/ murein hydrolase activator NlpD
MEELTKKKSPRMITIWVFLDQTAKPYQYRLDLVKLKKWAYVAAAIPILLVITGLISAGLAWHNRRLAEIADRYQVSEQELRALSAQLQSMETNVTQNSRQTRQLIAGMEKDLQRWWPEGGVGGGEELKDRKAKGPALALTPSQLDQLRSLDQRLTRLKDQLIEHETAKTEIEESWQTRNNVLSTIPSLWPVPGGVITSEFGMRIHPLTNVLQIHEGIDIHAPLGTKVLAAAPGRVKFAAEKTDFGFAVELDHGYGLCTFYAHCGKLLVKPGQAVERGQALAEVGSTGLSTGPHLHFEVRILGMPVDPMQYLNYSPGLAAKGE